MDVFCRVFGWMIESLFEMGGDLDIGFVFGKLLALVSLGTRRWTWLAEL